MKKLVSIEGMSCGHCVRHVEEALKELAGVVSVVVDLKGKNAVVEMNQELSDEQIKGAIEEAGYDVVGIKGL
ncbi:heavy-metal-associated domain-containing protein [Geosporobacter ferrireducens]|uniref:Heavy metal transport/detoxification protein n=1 Tax=Geosporobacter ferrireducens TaxID=1424294 RepID=A0A1D8GE51_9FIRM|nr:copper ion binding protein [Geosporobacter ferrireducens]AOT69191.1 heavy metal transport/detoxification protein [Geosporobacter ferrireducens]MTI56870.1 heavy-metal-associated domain-containing protein [Geosporobacter ferrireducens]